VRLLDQAWRIACIYSCLCRTAAISWVISAQLICPFQAAKTGDLLSHIVCQMHDGKCSRCLESTLAAGQFDLRTQEALHDVVGGVSVRSISLVVHPFRLDQLCKYTKASGIVCFRLSLRGGDTGNSGFICFSISRPRTEHWVCLVVLPSLSRAYLPLSPVYHPCHNAVQVVVSTKTKAKTSSVALELELV
jgi:hypothetical protein